MIRPHDKAKINSSHTFEILRMLVSHSTVLYFGLACQLIYYIQLSTPTVYRNFGNNTLYFLVETKD